MILRRLCEAAPQFDFPPVGYQEGPVKWLVDLDAKGHCLGFVPTVGDEQRRNDPGKVIRYPATVIPRSGTDAPAQLLADKASYALGYAGEADGGKAARDHEKFVSLVEACFAATGLSSVGVVLQTLKGKTCEARLPADLKPGDVLTFRVMQELPIEAPAVRDFWAACVEEERRERAGEPEACLVCGAAKPIADRHPLKIKGIPGGQTSGCSVVSANSEAFNSYGREAGLISPVCWDCALTYAQVLNALLADPKHHYRLQDRLVYVFWTREQSGFDITTALFTPDPAQVKLMLTAVDTGKHSAVKDPNEFYALALSGSGGRVVVRDWLETTVGHVQRNLARYFAALALVDNDGQEGPPLGVFALLGALLPGKGSNPWKELPPNLAAQFVHAVLNGDPLPPTLLYRAVARARAEQGLTRPRAALIKLCLLLSSHPEEGLKLTPELNPELDDPGYLCGRLLAILENIQSAAIPGAKATLIDKYYGTAATAPAAVFGLLMRQAQAHLGKLRKTNEGAHYRLQQALEAVAGRLDHFPPILRLNEQGAFALGYYQQRAADRAARNDAIAAKKLTAGNNDPQGGTDNV